MKIEMHAHSSPVSPCSRVAPADLVATYEELGYDALVLTNHYSEYSWPDLGGTQAEKVEAYLDDYRAALAAARTIKVFLGAEVAIRGPYSRAEFLLYGIDEDFLRRSPCLIELSQQALYERVHEAGAVMVQAHPFRTEFVMVPQDPRFMDGVEINCHPHHLRREEDVLYFADWNGLLVTAGSDFHGDARPSAGILTDRPASTVSELADILRAGEYRCFYGRETVASPRLKK